jgi:hypothetical protein
VLIVSLLSVLLLGLSPGQDVPWAGLTYDKSQSQQALDGMLKELAACFPDEGRLKTGEWRDAVAAARSSLRDGMTVGELQHVLQRLVVHIHDGHTMVAPTYQRLPRQIDLATTYFDGTLVAWVAYTPDVPPGSRITRVGDKTAAEALEEALLEVSHDDRESGLRRAAALLPTRKELFAGGRENLVIEYVAPGKTEPATVTYKRPADLEQGVEQPGQPESSRRRPLPWWSSAGLIAPFSFQMLERDERVVAGYLHIYAFSCRESPGAPASAPSFKETLKDLFGQMEEKGAKTLIVDVRDNSGGNSQMIDMLLAHMTKEKKVVKGFKAVRRVSARYLEQRPNERDAIPEKYHGGYWEPPGSGMLLEPAEPYFGRKLIVLTNPGTFSSAEMLAAIVQDNKLGITVGEPTAGSAVGLGDVLAIPLPIKELRLYVSSTRWTRPDPSGERPNVVMPDVPAPETYAAYLARKDVALEKALEIAAAEE